MLSVNLCGVRITENGRKLACVIIAQIMAGKAGCTVYYKTHVLPLKKRLNMLVSVLFECTQVL